MNLKPIPIFVEFSLSCTTNLYCNYERLKSDASSKQIASLDKKMCCSETVNFIKPILNVKPVPFHYSLDINYRK